MIIVDRSSYKFIQMKNSKIYYRTYTRKELLLRVLSNYKLEERVWENVGLKV